MTDRNEDRPARIDPTEAQDGIPDREDTGGGPRGGNTVDGRTGPGESGAGGGPDSSLRVHHDFSGDGNIPEVVDNDPLSTMGGVVDDDEGTDDGRGS